MSAVGGTSAAVPRVAAAELPRGRAAWRRALSSPKVVIGACMLVPIVLLAVFGPLVAPYDYVQQGTGAPLAGPSSEHWLGTDLYGRDVLSRMIAGARIAIVVPLVVGLAAGVLGVAIGLVAGYFGGVADGVAMRGVDVWLSFPWLLVALGLVAVMGRGLTTVLVALTVVYTPQVARLTRNTVQSVRSQEFVEAGHALGERTTTLLLAYVLRNAYFPILVLLTSMLAFSILNEAGMSYLGFGVQSPQTSWGLELTDAVQYINVAPHLAIFPGLAIAWIVLGFNLLGDGLGDLLDETRGGS